MAKNWSFLQGVLAASAEVAAVTGKQKIEGMSEREWQLIAELHTRLAKLSADCATELEKKGARDAPPRR